VESEEREEEEVREEEGKVKTRRLTSEFSRRVPIAG
jgi:hypothetical protein